MRSDPEDVEDVRSVLARTIDPESPDEVDVTRPSDAIEARAAAKSTFTSLFLGLGAVALLVGGVAGVALGAAVAGVYASSRGWEVVVPPAVLVGGVLAALAVGAVAGLYPALRAARLAPVEALRSV